MRILVEYIRKSNVRCADGMINAMSSDINTSLYLNRIHTAVIEMIYIRLTKQSY